MSNCLSHLSIGVLAKEVGRLFCSQVFSLPGTERSEAGSKLGGGVDPALDPRRDRAIGVFSDPEDVAGAGVEESVWNSPSCCRSLAKSHVEIQGQCLAMVANSGYVRQSIVP